MKTSKAAKSGKEIPVETLKEKLIASEVRYRRLFESAKDGILILDAETGRIIDVNPYLVRLLGFSKEEFIEKEIWEIGVFRDVAANKDKFRDLQQQEYVRCDNLPLETFEGHKIHVEFVSNVYLENHRKIIQCNIRDITRRKIFENALIESELKYRSFFENNIDAILLTSPDGKTLSVNQAACDMFGYTSEEMLKLGRAGIEDPTDLRLSFLVAERARTGSARGEVTFIHKGGTHFPAEISTSIFKNGEGLDRASLIIHNITERKRIEKELIQAKEIAEKSDHLKTAFLANMSHEIRTPMNGILGFTDLLKESVLTFEEQKKYLDIIEQSGFRMLNLINDIISISRIESGETDVFVSFTKINELIKNICTFYNDEAELKKLKLLFSDRLTDTEALIKTDSEKVSAVINHVIKNAIKFTSEGSIEIGYKLKTGFLEFFIKDTGMGVPPDKKEIIFERFRQGSELLNRNYEGAGLGLSISKAYVQMLGGEIWVENNPDQTIKSSSGPAAGSVFYFTIPYNPAEPGEILLKNIKNDDFELNMKKTLKILIVEDDKLSELLISIIARDISDNILRVGTGRAAVDACHGHPEIDLILMDIKMPEMDGYEATRQIREFNKNVIIIAQTAYALEGDRQKSIAAGCNDYISKPFTQVKLREMIGKHLKNHINLVS